ncbi:OmpA family protein [Pseudarcicella hirudinis]|uniref:OmpA family protein n=1 Tax=Pseudarcicella hirudinis TaxID=1079859 RepID=UPI0035E98BA2
MEITEGIRGGSSGNGTYGGTSGTQYPGDDDNGRSADRGVHVSNIRLTDQYTILYMSFINLTKPQRDQNGRVLNPEQHIAFKKSATLIAAQGSRTFRLIKAEGIPVLNDNQNIDDLGYNTRSGEQVNFVLYFERLDKGLEYFDLFECNDYDHLVCWNVYDLHTINPNDPVVYKPSPPAPAPGKPSTGTNPVKKPGKIGEVDNTPKPVPPAAVPNIMISGLVKDAKTQKPVSATIDYKISSSKLKIDSVQSFASTGIYKMYLPKGQVYTYVASAKGYIVTNDVIDLSKANNQNITRDIYLTPLSIGDKITLKNIYFEVSKSDLLPASYAELDKLVTMMNDNPKMEIRLEGHTDIVGDHDANLELSQARVDACKEYILRNGISGYRLQAIGYGDTKPILKKGTDEERKVNRRVEFVILKL